MLNENVKSIIIVMLLFLIPSVLGGLLFNLGLLEPVSSILAVLVVAVPIIVTFYLVVKSIQELDHSQVALIFVICLVIGLVLFLAIGNISLLLTEYFVPIILYVMLKRSRETT